ncbi:MAG: hypothetical protein ACI9IV_000956 [Paracoccaceae bacterium]|jgi:hypothetical protein
MRPLMHSDVDIAARVLLSTLAIHRPTKARRMIREANAADLHRRRFGALHPVWGNGSLASTASRYPNIPNAGFGSAEYCSCFALMLEALVDCKNAPRSEAGNLPPETSHGLM